jgi:hypothetical protein
MIPLLLDPALWVGLLAGWAIFASVQRLYARFGRRGEKAGERSTDPPRGINLVDVREGLYQHGPPADTPVQWAIALSALDCERERFYHDRLDLLPPDARQAARFMARFASRHEINSPAAWTMRLRWLREGGHRRDIALIRALMSRLARGEQTHDAGSTGDWLSAFSHTYGPLRGMREQQFRALREQPDRWRRLNGLAYDASRMVLYYRAGCRLGYVAEAEARTRIEEVAQEVAMHYADWQDFETDLLLTAGFVEDNAASAQTAALRLRAAGNAPWQVLTWPVMREPTVS